MGNYTNYSPPSTCYCGHSANSHNLPGFVGKCRECNNNTHSFDPSRVPPGSPMYPQYGIWDTPLTLSRIP